MRREQIKSLWNKIDYTFIRFVLVGVVNTLFGVGLYCLFIYAGLSYRLSVLLSTVLGVLFNFKTIGTFVFKNKDNKLIFKFVLAYVIIYCVNVGIIHLILELTPLNEYYAGFIATPIVAISSFTLQKYFVFRSKK